MQQVEVLMFDMTLLCMQIGCKIKALRAKTNTYIKTPVRGEDPVFSISGRPEHVSSAKREILELVEHLSELRAPRKGTEDKVTTIRIRVPYKVVGLVVGPKGATVKRIQQATQTYIVTPSRHKEPYFEVKGPPANVEKAKKEIERYIALRTKESFDLSEEQVISAMPEDNLAAHFHKGLRVESLTCDIASISSPTIQFQCMEEMPQTIASSQEYSYLPHSVSKVPSVFQFPTASVPPTSAGGGSSVFSGDSWEPLGISGGSSVPGDPQKHSNNLSYKTSPMFSGMRFSHHTNSYQSFPTSLSSEISFSQTSMMKNGAQPISPTGSFESNGSDGLSSVSPNLSPHPRLLSTLSSAHGTCYFCNANEDLAALVPCRHSSFCQSCAHYVACAQGSCPICHTQVTNVMQL